MSYWVRIFYQLVVNGRKTVNDIPNSIKQDVINLLVQDGYLIKEDGTVS